MRYDLEGHTFDCKQCGEEHKQFHPKHIYCCLVCMWKYQDTPTEQKTCKDCGCTDTIKVRKGKNYTCSTCGLFKYNSERTDIVRRDPTDYTDSGLRTYA